MSIPCQEVEMKSLAEAYVLGQLQGEERLAYEAHYFECERCFAELEMVRAVRVAVGSRKKVPGVRRWAVAAGVAVSLLGGGLVLRTKNVEVPPVVVVAQPPVALVELARMEAPEYRKQVLRGESGDAGFAAAMEKYGQKDYAGAAAMLESVKRPEADYYLAVCRMMQRNWSGALEAGRRVADTDSPYSEGAQMLVARALLAQGELAGARKVLLEVAKLDGDRREEAEGLLARLSGR